MRCLVIFVLVVLGGAAFAEAPVWVTPKHRAAPPEDMLPGGVLAPVNPAEFSQWSRGAMLRIDLDAEGKWQGSLPVDAAGDLRIMPISEAGDALVLTLEAEDGRVIRLFPDTRDARTETSQILGIGSFAGYTVKADRTGVWRAAIDAPEGTSGVFLAYATESRLGIRSSRMTDRTVVGRAIGFQASVHAEPSLPPRRDVEMSMAVIRPDGTRQTVAMTDDGSGHFAGSFVPGSPGRFAVQVVAEGEGYLRTSQHVVSVVAEDISLGESAAAWLREQARAFRIEIAANDHGRSEHCRVTAQVWGRDARGQAVPICWIGGMTSLQVDSDGNAVLPLDVNTGWFTRASAVGPFELRNVEVRCPRTMALLCGSDVIPLSLDLAVDLPEDQFVRREDLGNDIRTAPRSDDLAFPVDISVPAASRLAGGHNLLLIHGYCAGGNPWPLSDFTGALEVFSDPESNRSHDEFALLIKVLADTTKSSGVVAHSQGGAAALHLYTYYFSALDWAEGPRLIQSVGTPYQGTPLAGNLGALGGIFGTGCGANTDLSVEGSAVWLSGIPMDARSRVHYWTTSSAGPWCNFFSGLFLANPEDGVIEVSRGQLPGGNGMGNTVGQCHTTGMSEPAQYLDSIRNSEMNANAAR